MHEHHSTPPDAGNGATVATDVVFPLGPGRPPLRMSASADDVDLESLAIRVAEESGRLRQYQLTAIEQTARGWANKAAQLVNLPTGCGKTRTALALVALTLAKGERVLWLAHRGELLRQPADDVRRLYPELAHLIGVVKAERRDYRARLVFASIQTVTRQRHLDAVLEGGPFGLVVYDECHHSVSDANIALLNRLSESSRRFLGLTATVERGDKQSLDVFWSLAFSLPITQALAEGHLTPPRIVIDRIEGVDMDALKAEFTDEGQIDYAGLGDYLITREVVPHTVSAIGRHAAQRRGVVFCCSVRQAVLTSERLNYEGIPSAWLSGETPAGERAALIASHRAGGTRWLVNCDVLTEGYDDSTIDAIVLARPASSKPIYLQAVGRGLRRHPGKADCLILDVAGASDEHDLLQAPTLTPGREAQARKGGSGAPGRTEGAGLFNKRERTEFFWLELKGLSTEVHVAAYGAKGTIAIVRHADGAWSTFELPRDAKPRTLASRVSAEEAQAFGDDAIRRGGSLTWRLASPASDYNKQDVAPTGAQSSILRREGLTAETRAEASRLITAIRARESLIRLGIARAA